MLLGRVSFVPNEPKLREHGIPLAHASIARRLGQNRRRGDALYLSVPVDNGFVWNSQVQRDSVGQEVITSGVEGFELPASSPISMPGRC